MAADYIVVNRAKQLGNNLIRAAELLRELQNLTDDLNNIGQHCFNSSDFTVFEAQFGLSNGVGANTLTLIGLINTIMNTNTTVDGASRISQINEFVARLAGQ